MIDIILWYTLGYTFGSTFWFLMQNVICPFAANFLCVITKLLSCSFIWIFPSFKGDGILCYLLKNIDYNCLKINLAHVEYQMQTDLLFSELFSFWQFHWLTTPSNFNELYSSSRNNHYFLQSKHKNHCFLNVSVIFQWSSVTCLTGEAQLPKSNHQHVPMAIATSPMGNVFIFLSGVFFIVHRKPGQKSRIEGFHWMDWSRGNHVFKANDFPSN